MLALHAFSPWRASEFFPAGIWTGPSAFIYFCRSRPLPADIHVVAYFCFCWIEEPPRPQFCLGLVGMSSGVSKRESRTPRDGSAREGSWLAT